MPFDCTTESRDARILFRAAEWVERGHCKHALARDHTGVSAYICPINNIAQVCLAGGIAMALSEEAGDQVLSFTQPRWTAMIEETGRLVGGHALLCELVSWNNQEKTSQAEVAAKLRELAREKIHAAG